MEADILDVVRNACEAEVRLHPPRWPELVEDEPAGGLGAAAAAPPLRMLLRRGERLEVLGVCFAVKLTCADESAKMSDI